MRAYRCLAVAAVICLACPAFGQAAADEPATLPESAQELALAAPDPPADEAAAEPEVAAYDDAPVEVLWQRQFGTSEGDYATDVGLDSEGNCYVTGTTYGRLGDEHLGESDVFIVKYDHNGDRLWLRQVGTANRDSGCDIAVDGDGNCLVTGVTTGSFGGKSAGDTDVFLLKCSAEGEVLWVSQIGGEWRDDAGGVAVDGEGNSYICGSTFNNLVDGGPSSTLDIFVAKYSPEGAQMWIHRFGGDALNDAHDRASDITVTDGGICVVGTGDIVAGAQGDGRGLVFFCDSDGKWLSGDQFGQDRIDTAHCVTVDAAGNCYVAGFLWGDDTHQDDFFAAKYGGDHVRQWLVQTGTEEKEAANGVAVDDSGVYIAGRTGGSIALVAEPTGGARFVEGGVQNGLLIKYDFDGTEQWRWEFGSGEWDSVADIALDAEGNCYIVGYSKGALAGENQGDADAFIMVLSLTDEAVDDDPSGDAPQGHPADSPANARDDASAEDAPADDPAGNSSAE